MPSEAGLYAVDTVERRGGRLLRYCLAAAGIDGAFYLTLTGVPYKAMELGATPLLVGLLPAVWSVVYITGCAVSGHLDRWTRLGMARAGACVLAGAILIVAATPVLPGMFVGLAVAAIGLSLFWPALQAAIAESGSPRDLGRDLGWFNLSWSGGKSIGFLIGGAILAALGFGALFGIAIVAVLGTALQLGSLRGAVARSGSPGHSRAAVPASEIEPDPDHVPAARRRAYLVLAWIANGASYGAAATLIYHYPRLLESLGLGAGLFGLFLGFVYLSQTITFIILMRTVRWHYRRLPLYIVQAALAALLFVLPSIRVPALVVLAAPIIGVELGLSYYSSIYYSLHVAERPGRNTGYHEAVIGSGSLLVPPLSGWLASVSGDHTLPFLFCAGVIVLAILSEEVVVRSTSRPMVRSSAS